MLFEQSVAKEYIADTCKPSQRSQGSFILNKIRSKCTEEEDVLCKKIAASYHIHHSLLYFIKVLQISKATLANWGICPSVGKL